MRKAAEKIFIKTAGNDKLRNNGEMRNGRQKLASAVMERLTKAPPTKPECTSEMKPFTLSKGRAKGTGGKKEGQASSDIADRLPPKSSMRAKASHKNRETKEKKRENSEGFLVKWVGKKKKDGNLILLYLPV